MKASCDIVRDLMPLCMDDEASKDSKDSVEEHLKGCTPCKAYWDELASEQHTEVVSPEVSEETNHYASIAKRLRKKKNSTRVFYALVTLLVYLAMMNFALGFRLTPEAAAKTSRRLNYSSEQTGSYDWGPVQFYFYESENSYEVVTAMRHWNGWQVSESSLVWPKYWTDKGGIINAGTLYFWTDNYEKYGIQLFPLIVEDSEVASIEVTVFGQTKTLQAKQGELMLITFENRDTSIGNQTTGKAYDASGNVIYTLTESEDTMRLYWKKIE